MISLQNKIKWIPLLLLTLAGIVLSSNIRVNDNAIDLLPGEAVRGDLALLQRLGLVNRVIITLSLDSNSAAEAEIQGLKTATGSIGRRLEQSEYFSNEVYRIPEEDGLHSIAGIRKNMPLLLNSNDLEQIGSLTDNVNIAASLKKVFNLLNSPAGYGLKNHLQHDPLGIAASFSRNLKYLKAEYSLILEDGFFLSNDRHSSLLIAESTQQLTDADSAVFISKLLATIFTEELPEGITPRIIGSLPHTIANADSVKHDLKTLLPAATVLLLSLLFFALRSIRALLVMAIPFLAAPAAISITAAIFTQISALALGFGIVLLGIAVDFSIHIYTGLTRTAAQERGSFLQNIRKPILLATLTTVSVFLVVLLSDIPSHRQMATLSLFGIILAVCYSWILVPLIIPKKEAAVSSKRNHFLLRVSPFFRKLMLAGWFFLVSAGVMSWTSLQYNGNLQTLDALNDRVAADESHFSATWGGTGSQAFVIARGATLDEALRHNYFVFSTLREYKNATFQTIAPLLPSLQDQHQNLQSWQNFWTSQNNFHQRFLSESAELGFSHAAFQPFLRSLQHPPAPHDLLPDWPNSLNLLMRSMLRKTDGGHKDEPQHYLVTTTVTVSDSLYDTLIQLERSSPNITLLANKKWRDQVEKQLRRDMVRLSLTAAFIITIIIIVYFRSTRVVAGVLAPVISALAAMAVFSAITGKELNMMHLLMGIMVIGLAVDYGIFTACTINTNSAGHSLTAISICALSSLIGFGVLSFAQHPALHSLGITVLVGIGAAWPTAIFISPIFLGGRSVEAC